MADSLYWMSRYLERAEHTARLLDVSLAQTLDETPEAAERRWERLWTSLALAPPAEGAADSPAVIAALTAEVGQASSIVACVAAARENARQVREQISSEMWEQLNRLYLGLRGLDQDLAWRSEPHRVFALVKEGAHLFQGITDATLSHGEGWHFIQIGRYLERAVATARLLDVHFRAQVVDLSDAPPDWVGLLKSCTAFEAYCKVYTNDVQAPRVAEFLLLNPDFPRSVRFAVDTVQISLQAIAGLTGRRQAGRVQRLAGRLRAALDYAVIDEIMAEDMHAFLESIERQCGQIHLAIQQVYIAYPVDVALAS